MEGIELTIDGSVVATVVRSAKEQYTISAANDRIRGIVTKAVSPGSLFRRKFSENMLFMPSCIQDLLPKIRARRMRSGL